uniref:Uncharacterized protein n=1 Tax=Nicotiana tabacum TaxID=4097 RepID=A0A1S4D6S3_TOBAC|nr:PREDICTED: uncharacterized protein LOC107826604 [Nicotiana tabacum]
MDTNIAEQQAVNEVTKQDEQASVAANLNQHGPLMILSSGKVVGNVNVNVNQDERQQVQVGNKSAVFEVEEDGHVNTTVGGDNEANNQLVVVEDSNNRTHIPSPVTIGKTLNAAAPKFNPKSPGTGVSKEGNNGNSIDKVKDTFATNKESTSQWLGDDKLWSDQIEEDSEKGELRGDEEDSDDQDIAEDDQHGEEEQSVNRQDVKAVTARNDNQINDQPNVENNLLNDPGGTRGDKSGNEEKAKVEKSPILIPMRNQLAAQQKDHGNNENVGGKWRDMDEESTARNFMNVARQGDLSPREIEKGKSAGRGKKKQSIENQSNRERLMKVQADFIKYLALEEEFWKHKSGMSWFKDAYRNTKFFHAQVNGRRKRLELKRIQNSEGT